MFNQNSLGLQQRIDKIDKIRLLNALATNLVVDSLCRAINKLLIGAALFRASQVGSRFMHAHSELQCERPQLVFWSYLKTGLQAYIKVLYLHCLWVKKNSLNSVSFQSNRKLCQLLLLQTLCRRARSRHRVHQQSFKAAVVITQPDGVESPVC